MGVEDARQTRMIQRELTRRYVDMSMVDVRVIHGVVYLRGMMQSLRTYPNIDLEQEAEIIQKILRQKPGIREVNWEVRIRGK